MLDFIYRVKIVTISTKPFKLFGMLLFGAIEFYITPSSLHLYHALNGHANIHISNIKHKRTKGIKLFFSLIHIPISIHQLLLKFDPDF